MSSDACLPSMKARGIAFGVRISYLEEKRDLISVSVSDTDHWQGKKREREGEREREREDRWL